MPSLANIGSVWTLYLALMMQRTARFWSVISLLIRLLFDLPHAPIPYSMNDLKSELYIVNLTLTDIICLSFDSAYTAFEAFPQT